MRTLTMLWIGAAAIGVAAQPAHAMGRSPAGESSGARTVQEAGERGSTSTFGESLTTTPGSTGAAGTTPGSPSPAGGAATSPTTSPQGLTTPGGGASTTGTAGSGSPRLGAPPGTGAGAAGGS